MSSVRDPKSAIRNVVVLGIGNILMRDEGVGVRLMEAVRDSRHWPDDIEFIDGGVGGLNLLSVIETAPALVVFDAAEMRLPPGTHRILAPQQLAPESGPSLSLHHMPFVQTLELAERFFRRPAQIAILAVQPEVVDYGRQLSPALSAAMPALVAAASDLIQRQHDVMLRRET